MLAQIKQIDVDVGKLENVKPGIRITDHAVLRYLERVKGLDLKEVRRELLPVEIEKQIRAVGCAGVYPVFKSHKLRVRDNTIITVLGADMG